MEMILNYLHQGVTAVLPFVILLGLLVFVHELGHFLVAKFFKVRVEVFSLGFGKKIFQYKYGDTNYCISIIPLGGYVKMYGDEPGVEVPEDQKPYSFSHKPIFPRFMVVLAGPMMNFFFAILVFAVMAAIGEQMLTPVVGDVTTQSEAYRVGFRPNDTIKTIDGKQVRSWDDIQEAIESHANQLLHFTVARSGQTVALADTPKLIKNKSPLSIHDYVGDIDGLSYDSRASTIGVFNPKGVAALAGLKTGDDITAINGKELSTWRDLESRIVPVAGTRVQLKVDREINDKDSKTLTIALQIPSGTSSAAIFKALGIEPSDLYLAQIIDKSPAQLAGLLPGDRITAINRQKIDDWETVVALVKSYHRNSGPMEIKVLRDGATKIFNITPQMTKHMNSQGKDEERYTLGILPHVSLVTAPTFIQRTTSPVAALVRGWDLSIKWTNLTLIGFVRLIQDQVSPRNLGGVISIGQIASRSYEIGMSAFLSIMAIISINLFIVNLLPVPILDGGHLLFYTLEALRGRPLSLKNLEMAQQVGLLILISLMAFSFFNDITRILNLPW